MSIFYIPKGNSSGLDRKVDDIATAVRNLKSSHAVDDQRIQELENRFRTNGLNSWNAATTYQKDEIVLFGDTSFNAGFYKSLKNDNVGHWPSAADSGPWWMIIAGDYVVQMAGDVSGYSTDNAVRNVGGASAAEVAAVTEAIKSGTLDHPTALTIGETAPVINIGTGAAPKTINLGGGGDTVAVAGTLVTVNTDNLQVKDSLVRLNRQGLAGSAADAGIEIEEAGAVAAYVKTNGMRDGFVLKAPVGSEFALNQSVATGSSPSFQNVSTAGTVQAGGSVSSQSFTAPVGPGSYMAHGSGALPGGSVFMNQPGSDAGGWRWLMYSSNNEFLANPMTLTRSGELTAAGYVNSIGLKSDKGIVVNNWDTEAVRINNAFIGRNRAGGTPGRMSFGCHPGGGSGGFEWLTYGGNGTNPDSIPMTLTRDGNLTVTGTITANNVPVSQSTSLVGLWGGAFSNLAGGVSVRKFGPMVTVDIGYFDLSATHATNEGVFSEMLPTWARPLVGNRPLTFAVPFINGTSTLARLYISSAGRISFKPESQWSISPARPDGTISVSYCV